jgi:hypothetical protein
MRFAVYHDDTLELLGTLESREYPERMHGPMRDGKRFELPAMEMVPARPYEVGSEAEPVMFKIAFRPLVFRNKSAATFALFVDCHPNELQKVRGFKPL